MKIEKRFSQFSMPRGTALTKSMLWLRYAIIAGVFLISIVVSLRPTSRIPLLIAALLLVALAVTILLRNMAIGLLGIVFACFLIPNFLGSGSMGATLSPPVLLLILVIGLWFLDMLARQKQIKLVRSRTTLPAIILVIIALIAFFNGQISYLSFARLAPITAQIGGLAVFLLSIGAFLVTGNLINDLKWLRGLTWLFLVISALYIFGRLFPSAGYVILPRFQHGDSSIFWIWIVAMSSSQAVFNPQLDKRWRIALFCLCVATLYVSIFQAYSWKSGWLPSLVALFVVFWIGIPRFRIPGLLIAGVAVIIISSDQLSNLVTGGEDYSIMTRVLAWRIVLELSKANPLLGLGFANYYWYTPLIPILGYRVNFNSHNNYVDIIAQTGLIGLACFLWFVIELGRLGWEMHKKVSDGFARAYVIGVLGGLAASLVSGMLGDWILPFVYNVGLAGFRSSLIGWLFFGGLLAIERLYGGREDAAAEGIA